MSDVPGADAAHTDPEPTEAGVPSDAGAVNGGNDVPQKESHSAGDGEFDDFGEFEDGDDFQDAGAQEQENEAAAKSSVRPLRIYDGADIAAQVQELLPAEFGPHAPGLGDEDIRQLEGPAQVLVTESSRTLFRELQAEDPKPALLLNWTRSQTRRQQLLALGVPINLDEMLGGDAQHKELPPLELQIESAPQADTGGISSPATGSDAAAPAPQTESLGDRRRRELGVDVPVVDTERIEQVTQLSEDDLKLQSLPALRNLVKELQALSAQTTDLLAYYLMLRDMFTADSEMYNGMIKDLVAGASSRVSSRRRGSLGFIGLGRTDSSSGRSTPT